MDLCTVNVQIPVSTFYNTTYYQCIMDLGRSSMRSHWSYEVRSSNNAWPFVQTCQGLPGTGSFRKQHSRAKKGIPTQTHGYYWPLWRPVMGRVAFSVISPGLHHWKTTGYVTLTHGAWRLVSYQMCENGVATACGIRGWRNLGRYAWPRNMMLLWYIYLAPHRNHNCFEKIYVRRFAR